MDIAAVGVIVALLGLLGTIAGVVFALGKRDSRLDNLEERVKEDREKNSDQHKEFYSMRETVAAITPLYEAIKERLDKVEEGVMEILRRMPNNGGGK
jgi:hypothetical protein